MSYFYGNKFTFIWISLLFTDVTDISHTAEYPINKIKASLNVTVTFLFFSWLQWKKKNKVKKKYTFDLFFLFRFKIASIFISKRNQGHNECMYVETQL